MFPTENPLRLVIPDIATIILKDNMLDVSLNRQWEDFETRILNSKAADRFQGLPKRTIESLKEAANASQPISLKKKVRKNAYYFLDNVRKLICPYCGKDVPKEYPICTNCGENMPGIMKNVNGTYQESWICPSCKATLSIEDHECSHCGFHFLNFREKYKKKQTKATLLDRHPGLLPLVRKYAYNQLRALQENIGDVLPRFANLTRESLAFDLKFEKLIKTQLREKFAKFIQYLDLGGTKLGELEREVAFELAVSESEPITKEIKQVMIDHFQDVQQQKKLEEAQKKLELRKELSSELFGEEIVTAEDLGEVERYKTVQDKLDELLRSYQEWGDSGKKM